MRDAITITVAVLGNVAALAWWLWSMWNDPANVQNREAWKARRRNGPAPINRRPEPTPAPPPRRSP